MDSTGSGVGPSNSVENEGYDLVGEGAPVSIEASLLSLPERGGGFAVADYLGPELAAFARAEGPALEDEVVAGLAAACTRSCHKAEPAEYVGTLRRMFEAAMIEWSATKLAHPLGLLGRGSDSGKPRPLFQNSELIFAQYLFPDIGQISCITYQLGTPTKVYSPMLGKYRALPASIKGIEAGSSLYLPNIEDKTSRRKKK